MQSSYCCERQTHCGRIALVLSIPSKQGNQLKESTISVPNQWFNKTEYSWHHVNIKRHKQATLAGVL